MSTSKHGWQQQVLLPVLVFAYTVSFVVPGSHGIGFLIGLLCLTRLFYPTGASVPDPSIPGARDVQEQRIGEVRYSIGEIMLLGSLPFVILYLVQYHPLPIDRIFTYTLNSGTMVYLFPGFYLLVLYVLPFVWRIGIRGETFRALGFRLGGLELLLIVLTILPLIVRYYRTGPLVVQADPDRETIAALLAAMKAYYQPGFWEELYFRGFLFAMLRTRMRFLPAALLSALLFTGIHFDVIGEALRGTALAWHNLLSIFLLGAVLAYVYERSRSIIICILYHGTIVGAQYAVIFILRVKWGV